jgi:ABC-type sugar transport system ATPase subunit
MTAAGAPLLAARGITRRFGAVLALDAVDADVRPGEILALAGENGSGKSTLAKVMAGVIRPDAGELLLDGRPRAFSRPREALDAGIALVTQELTAVPGMSVAENVLLPTLHRLGARVRQREQARRAAPFLAQVGLGHVDPLLPFAALRAGERELVEVAKALAARPRLLILDEATTRLPDPEALFGLVERLVAERGLAVVFITQRLREIRRLAHRALVLRDGRVAGELGRDELSDRALSRLMVGREVPEHERPPVRAGDVVLRVEGLVTERFPHPVSLEVRAGEVVGLAGLVGAGRSEVLETIAGARRPRGGRVVVDGRPVTARSPRAALRAGISLLPEDRRAQGLVLSASVCRNVAMSSWRPLRAARGRHEARRAAEAVQRLRIRTPDVDAEAWTLSGGNQQKVVIARCLAAAPRVLLLDEPTRGVDVGAREEIYRIVGDLAQAGTAILLVSSDLPEVLALCDRIVVLNEGAVAGELAREEATEERILLLGAGGGAAVAA